MHPPPLPLTCTCSFFDISLEWPFHPLLIHTSLGKVRLKYLSETGHIKESKSTRGTNKNNRYQSPLVIGAKNASN